MKQGAALLAAVGVSVAAHVWVLSDWAHTDRAAPLPRQPPELAHQGVQLRWVTLPTPTAPAEATAQASLHQAVDPGADARLAAAAPPEPSPSAPPTPSEGPAPTPPIANAEHFWLPAEVDIRALPLHAPDPTPLEGRPWLADQPVRLRLSINARGQVVAVTPRDAESAPAEVLEALSAMFMATPFMPARRQGQDVASLQDIEILP
jgi:hypothetical protein